jgi:hypothetical protein
VSGMKGSTGRGCTDMIAATPAGPVGAWPIAQGSLRRCGRHSTEARQGGQHPFRAQPAQPSPLTGSAAEDAQRAQNMRKTSNNGAQLLTSKVISMPGMGRTLQRVGSWP